ncbi:glutathione S-transferase [Granulosicoccaceae sp. 1_MG-2023]|nr:glutathione S-transferase [Granulosicoccaceae sp. 1_MG-2023]
MTTHLPRLYSFRRCPYAMRARLAILFAGLQVVLREVELKNKPAAMLEISPKGTVPVLQLADGTVIEESRDILFWALAQQDPHGLLDGDPAYAEALIERNDGEFKYWLDRYKYADRYPQMTQLCYRQRGEVFLQALESRLATQRCLSGERPGVADIAVMPFVRQFAHVDREAFYSLPYPNLQAWLQGWLAQPVFLQCMCRYQPWQEGAPELLFPQAGVFSNQPMTDGEKR